MTLPHRRSFDRRTYDAICHMWLPFQIREAWMGSVPSQKRELQKGLRLILVVCSMGMRTY